MLRHFNLRVTRMRKERSPRPHRRPRHTRSPFPLKLQGPVIKGFGHGSKDLGIPTANIPPSGHDTLASGIYYGFCTLNHSSIPSQTTSTSVPSATPNTTPLSASLHAVRDLAYPPHPAPVGYNLYYRNSQRSIEIHILHNFDKDFYGATLSLIILGFIRPEYNYMTLVDDTRGVCSERVGRPPY
ncbi:hypothetical protein GQ44DRAFT_743398 [Phaeosphaeriaceae sp. PMI808]|nr:hypothetical protein GQ44DRAFT_743398 [Phaeosphaeriaceae sp. PMI808]